MADEKAWVWLHEWAESTTRAWTKQTKAELRRQNRCQSMARLRVAKKDESLQMRRERELLEQQVKNHLALLNRSSLDQDQDTSNKRELRRAVHQLVLESDTLRTENAELHERLQRQQHFQSLVHDIAVDVNVRSEDDWSLSAQNINTASKEVRGRRRLEDGWRVQFPNGEPSFYFHPFTLSEHQHAVATCAYQAAQGSRSMPVTGRLFVWTVHRAPLSRTTADASLHGRIKLTARVACSLTVADEVIAGRGLNSWPLVFTPQNWSPAQRSSVSTQVLQSFDRDSHVMIFSIPGPGPVHTRYLLLARRREEVESNGKRSFTLILAINDSQLNARSRAAEQPRPNVEWIREGSALAKFVEVDQTTIDATCEVWAEFDSELHAQQVFTRWIEFVCGWSRGIMQSKLLGSGN